MTKAVGELPPEALSRRFDQGIALLTDRAAAQPDEHGILPEGTVNQAVAARLAEMAETLKEGGRIKERLDKNDGVPMLKYTGGQSALVVPRILRYDRKVVTKDTSESFRFCVRI